MKSVLRCYGEIYDIEIERAEGCYLYDAAGRRYIDFEAGVWCAALGHSHPAVTEAICEQAGRVMHLGYRYQHSIVAECAEKITELCGLPEGKAVFLSSGSEAVEFMVQMARRVTGRQNMIYLRGTYLSAFGSAGARPVDVWHEFDWDACGGCERPVGFDCPTLTRIDFAKVAGLVFEGGSSRVDIPPKKPVACLVHRLRQQRALLLANEVTTGFGRTGKWFGFQHYAVQPDMVALGKGMGNGYPVSAVAVDEGLAGEIEHSGIRYAQSHQNDALGCAVVLKVIGTIHEEGLVKRAEEIGPYLLEGLRPLVDGSPIYSECRGMGLMQMLQLSPSVSSQQAARLHEALFRRGYLLGYSPTLHAFRLFPPLTIAASDCDKLLSALRDTPLGS